MEVRNEEECSRIVILADTHRKKYILQRAFMTTILQPCPLDRYFANEIKEL